jgi:hypothetical protein
LEKAKARKDLFFEKKKQKTFTNSAWINGPDSPPETKLNKQKFFGSFFQKRTAFPSATGITDGGRPS